MKISGFTPSELFSFPLPEKESIQSPAMGRGQDMVSIQSLDALNDMDADALLGDTLGMIAQNGAAALNLHGGLSAGRVAELLAV